MRAHKLLVLLLCIAPCLQYAHAEEQPLFWLVRFDRIEYGEHEDLWNWDAEGWIGRDLQKLWWKTEGDTSGDDANLQLLYSRAVLPYWDLQLGVVHEIRPNQSENFAVIGFNGLARQWFEVDIAALLGEDGKVSVRLEAEYDLLLTQRLILQPRLELDSEPKLRQLGFRLRYEFRREVAPYIGIVWERSRIENSRSSVVVGASFWF